MMDGVLTDQGVTRLLGQSSDTGADDLVDGGSSREGLILQILEVNRVIVSNEECVQVRLSDGLHTTLARCVHPEAATSSVVQPNDVNKLIEIKDFVSLDVPISGASYKICPVIFDWTLSAVAHERYGSPLPLDVVFEVERSDEEDEGVEGYVDASDDEHNQEREEEIENGESEREEFETEHLLTDLLCKPTAFEMAARPWMLDKDGYADSSDQFLWKRRKYRAMRRSLLDIIRDPEPKRRRRYNKRIAEKHPRNSLWYKRFIVSDEYNQPSKARSFRNLFRMPRQVVLKFANEAREKNWFPSVERPDALGRVGAPLELLILGSLAYLGGSCSFEHIAIATEVSTVTHRSFLDRFVDIGATELFSKWVRLPETNEEIADAMKLYTEAGLPGCICSCDGTHVQLWMCPFNLKHASTGKEKYPTRSFQVAVDPTTKILSVSDGYLGTWNDMKTAKYDSFLTRLRDRTIYQDVEWELYDANGELETIKGGLYAICDKGYPKWSSLIPPYSYTSDLLKTEWSKWVESLRKDVERTFGCLKNRWRILKFGITLQRMEAVDKVFKCCCALHNLLLDALKNADDFRHAVVADQNTVIGNRIGNLAPTVASSAGLGTDVEDSEATFIEHAAFEELRDRLVRHYHRMREIGEPILWPSRTGVVQRVDS